MYARMCTHDVAARQTEWHIALNRSKITKSTTARRLPAQRENDALRCSNGSLQVRMYLPQRIRMNEWMNNEGLPIKMCHLMRTCLLIPTSVDGIAFVSLCVSTLIQTEVSSATVGNGWRLQWDMRIMSRMAYRGVLWTPNAVFTLKQATTIQPTWKNVNMTNAVNSVHIRNQFKANKSHKRQEIQSQHTIHLEF